MIKGEFKYGMPIVRLELNESKIEFLLDTGFNGQIMLPKTLIEKLGLKRIATSDFVTADGKLNYTEVYEGKIKILNKVLDVVILSTESRFCLAGIGLFDNCRIIIDRSRNILEISESI